MTVKRGDEVVIAHTFTFSSSTPAKISLQGMVQAEDENSPTHALVLGLVTGPTVEFR